MNNEKLQAKYLSKFERANYLRSAILEQISLLLDKNSITLGVPMESRVKSWASIDDKVTQKKYEISEIESLDDLIGVRVILLFKVDDEKVSEILRTNFNVISSEDTSSRLSDSQFGYQSRHFIVQIPNGWLALPTYSDLGIFKVEIQVRTLAQHIWAAASHKLQYKHEASVPPPLRRTINRVSALLEIVDLEFDRALAERENYRESEVKGKKDTDTLNVDLVRIVLSDVFPEKNSSEDDSFDALLENLFTLGVTTVGPLRELLIEGLAQAMKVEAREVSLRRGKRDYMGTSEDRINSGVFFTHVGLAREALKEKFGHENLMKAMGYHEGNMPKKT